MNVFHPTHSCLMWKVLTVSTVNGIASDTQW